MCWGPGPAGQTGKGRPGWQGKSATCWLRGHVGLAASRQGRLAGDLGNLRPIAHRSPGSATASATALAPVTARHGPGPCPSPCHRPAQPQSDSPGPGPSSYPVRGPRHAGPREAGEARGSPAWPSPAGTGRSPGVRGTRPGRPRCSRPRPAGSGPRGGRPGPGSTAGRGRLRPGHTPVPAALAGAVHAVTQPAPRGDTEAARAGAREPTPRHGHPVLAAWRSALRTPVRGLHRSPGPAARASPSRPVSPLRPRHQFPFLQQLQGVCHLHVREGDRTAARPPLGLVSRVRWFQTAQAERPSLECGNLGGPRQRQNRRADGRASGATARGAPAEPLPRQRKAPAPCTSRLPKASAR